MRPFRVFNNVTRVRTMWKFAGMRLGGLGQIAALTILSLGALLTSAAGPITAAVVTLIGLALLTFYSTLIARVDPAEVLSERTALRLIRTLMRSRYTNNYGPGDL